LQRLGSKTGWVDGDGGKHSEAIGQGLQTQLLGGTDHGRGLLVYFGECGGCHETIDVALIHLD
jgi:hypothetical protein